LPTTSPEIERCTTSPKRGTHKNRTNTKVGSPCPVKKSLSWGPGENGRGLHAGWNPERRHPVKKKRNAAYPRKKEVEKNLDNKTHNNNWGGNRHKNSLAKPGRTTMTTVDVKKAGTSFLRSQKSSPLRRGSEPATPGRFQIKVTSKPARREKKSFIIHEPAREKGLKNGGTQDKKASWRSKKKGNMHRRV